MRPTPAHVRRVPLSRVLARALVALLVTALAAAPGAWTATVASAAPTLTVVDTPGATCDGRGFTKINQPSGDETFDFGRLVWGGDTLTFTANPGWTVELCVKGGNDARLVEISRTGSYEYTHPQDISHIGYRLPQRTTVTALEPTVVLSTTCGVQGSLTVTPVTGLKYLLDGVEVTGTTPGPLAGTLTAEALPGYVLSAAFSREVSVPAATTCTGPPEQVTPVTAELVTSRTCGVADTLVVAETRGVEYLLGTSVVSGTLTGPLSGTLTARALPDFVLSAELSQPFTLAAAEVCPGPPPVTVTALAPSVVQSTACDVQGSLTVTPVSGVEYLLGDQVVTGTRSGPLSGTLTARAAQGSVLSAPFSQAVSIPAAKVCTSVLGGTLTPAAPPAAPPSVLPFAAQPAAAPAAAGASTLPFTGLQVVDLAGLGALLLLAGTGAVALGRPSRGAHARR